MQILTPSLYAALSYYSATGEYASYGAAAPADLETSTKELRAQKLLRPSCDEPSDEGTRALLYTRPVAENNWQIPDSYKVTGAGGGVVRVAPPARPGWERCGYTVKPAWWKGN